MCPLPCRKHVYQEYLVLQPMGSSTQSTGLARAFQWTKDGKWQSHHAATCSGWAVLFNQGIGLLRLTLIKLYHQLNKRRRCWTQDKDPALKTVPSKFLWSYQLTCNHLNCFTRLAHSWTLPWRAQWRPTGITNGASSYSSWDKTSPSWKCMFFFTGLKICWHDSLGLWQ